MAKYLTQDFKIITGTTSITKEDLINASDKQNWEFARQKGT